MPLLQYFGWVGSFLLAALFATNWCCSTPIPRAPLSDVPLNQKVHIRIHTDHKWPERVVLDTTRSTPVHDAKADGETVRAFAEMELSARPCFGPPCFTQDAEPEPSPIEKRAPFQNRSRLSMARKGLTLPSPPHKLLGRS